MQQLLQDCPLACTILHAQSQVCNSKKSYLLGLGTWTWFGAWSWFGLGMTTWLWTATAMAPAPTTATTSATRPAIINSNPNLNNLHRNKKRLQNFQAIAQNTLGSSLHVISDPKEVITAIYGKNVYTSTHYSFTSNTVKKMTATRVEIWC